MHLPTSVPPETQSTSRKHQTGKKQEKDSCDSQLATPLPASQRSEEGIGIPGTGDADGCKAP
ncbi:hypothetical protein STEG23_026584, partial [Scotinomys teguina]